MEIIYKTAILGTIILGVVHSFLTFRTYKKSDENAYWFFSAGLTLIILGISNFINLKTQTTTSIQLTAIANLMVFIFSICLSLKFRKITMCSVTLFTLILLVSSFLPLIK